MLRTEIITAARGWLGTPYHHQAARKGAGADCLGLVRGVLAEVTGLPLVAAPPYSADGGDSLGAETLLIAARRHLIEIAREGVAAGDVLLFRMLEGGPSRHCGILVSPALFIHAVSGRNVAEAAFSPWWRRRMTHAFSFPGVIG